MSGYNTHRTIWLVTVKGEEPKAFGSSALALEYKHNFCRSGSTTLQEILLFEKPLVTESNDSDEPGIKRTWDDSDMDL